MFLTRPPLPGRPCETTRTCDLHVLGTPPAFILSQDQTRHASYIDVSASRSRDANTRLNLCCELQSRPITRGLLPSRRRSGRRNERVLVARRLLCSHMLLYNSIDRNCVRLRLPASPPDGYQSGIRACLEPVAVLFSTLQLLRSPLRRLAHGPSLLPVYSFVSTNISFASCRRCSIAHL